MKKFGIIMMFVATFLATACSSVNSVLSSAATTDAGANGSNCAKALVALYKSKQANGNISITNTNDLANMLTIINCYNNLSSNKDNSNYKTNFATGMISGGSGMITTNNANTLMNKLLSSVNLSGVNAQNIAQKAETVQAILTLVNALK